MFFFFQAEDGIRDLVRSRGLGDVYKRQSRFSLQTLPADDFPRMTITEGETRDFQITQKAFRQLLGKTQFSMAAQDVRYYLNGLLLLVEGKELRAVATDGHRLAYASVEIEADLPRQEIILPRKTVLELNRLLVDNDEPLHITLASNQVRFAFGSVVLVSKLIDGKFPDYERVVPATLKNHVKVGRQLLMQAMNRAAILTNEKFRGVRVVLGENSLKLIAANAEQEEQSLFLARCQGDAPVEGTTMVAAQFRTAAADTVRHRLRIGLRAVISDEPVAQTVEAVRCTVGREVMEGPRLVEEVVLDDAVLVAGPARIERHLEVLVIDLDVMERELDVGEDAQPARCGAGIADHHIPELSLIHISEPTRPY